MRWALSDRADPASAAIADRHYSRQTVGAAQFVQPGRCVVLRADTATGRALWVTSWPFARYVRHQWAGAWQCSMFRNEGAGVASQLIIEAVAATRAVFAQCDDPGPPRLGLVTFINKSKVKPTMTRGRPVWGWTWLKAGFRPDGETKAGLLAFRLAPEDMPQPDPPVGHQPTLY